MVVDMPHPTTGFGEGGGQPAQSAATRPSTYRRHPPLLGEHTDEVLGELGYDRRRGRGSPRGGGGVRGRLASRIGEAIRHGRQRPGWSRGATGGLGRYKRKEELHGFQVRTEQDLFRQSVREWATKNLEPRARGIDKAEDGIPDDIVQGMVDLGVFGVTIPEELGGCAVPGEELTYAMIAIHEIARADLSHVDPGVHAADHRLVVHRQQVRHPAAASEEVLPAAAAGKAFVGINTTEPGGGSDLASIKTTAP